MATTIESLFGKSPEQLEYERQQAEQQRMDEMYATTLAGIKGDLPGFATGYALGYQGGEGLGQAVQGIFGAEPAKDPSLAKARKAREIFSKYGTGVFSDADKLTQLANDYADSDMFAEAMAIQQMATDLKASKPEQFYTATGEELMAQDPFTYRGLNKKATYQVSTKTKKATELIESKDADKETDETVLSGRQLGALNTITAIDEALVLADEWGTTGFVGAVIRSFGRFADTTDAGALGRTVETIKANIGFDRLQRMRDESKTGGALGQVAVQELNALRNSLAALEPSMSREQFKKNLMKIRNQYFSAMSKVPPEVLEKYGFDPSLSGTYTRQKSIDVSGKTQSTGSSAANRFNELNR